MLRVKELLHSKLSGRILPVPLLQASPQQITSHLAKLAKLHGICLNDIQEPSGYYSYSESGEKNTGLLLVLSDKNGIHIKTGSPEQLKDNLEHTLPRLLQRIVRIEQLLAEESYDTTPDGDDIVIPATYLPAKEVLLESVFLNRSKPGWDFYLALDSDYSADDMVTFSLQGSRKKFAMPMKRAVLYLLNDFLKAVRHSIELDLSLLGKENLTDKEASSETSDIEKLAEIITKHLQKNEEDEKLLNLKELAETIGIPYSTLSKKKLPFHRVGRKSQKLYSKSDVLKFLKRSSPK